MLLVGIDWADQAHTYCLMDEASTVLASGTIPHTAEGLDRLIAAIRTHAVGPQDVCVALETRHGPLVGALLEQGFTVYAINPKAVDRHRERFRVAGTKSDLRDAWVLGTLLRTDRALYRPLLPDSEVAQELRTLTRDRAARPGGRPARLTRAEAGVEGIPKAIAQKVVGHDRQDDEDPGDQ